MLMPTLLCYYEVKSKMKQPYLVLKLFSPCSSTDLQAGLILTNLLQSLVGFQIFHNHDHF